MNAVKYSQFQLSRIGQKNRCKNGHASMNFWTTQQPETISHHLLRYLVRFVEGVLEY